MALAKVSVSETFFWFQTRETGTETGYETRVLKAGVKPGLKPGFFRAGPSANLHPLRRPFTCVILQKHLRGCQAKPYYQAKPTAASETTPETTVP